MPIWSNGRPLGRISWLKVGQIYLAEERDGTINVTNSLAKLVVCVLLNQKQFSTI